MLSRILFLCLFVALCGTCSSLSCRWLPHKFRQCSEKSMERLDSMATHYIDTSDKTKDNETVAFPDDLYKQASSASAEDKFDFTVQVLEEVDVLFEEDHSSVSWDKVTVDHFRMVVNRQAEGFSKCIHNHRKPNKKLRLYFKNLSRNILQRNDHGAEAWELIRKEVKKHLLRLDLLVSSVLKGLAKN